MLRERKNYIKNMKSVKNFTIYTDGSCIRNPGNGGWAFYVKEINLLKSGGESHTTNNRMEMEGVIAALRFLEKNDFEKAEILCDSKLILKTITENWKKNKNTDLWTKIDSLILKLRDKKIVWQWVKGHAGEKYNEMVDTAAREEALKIENKKTVKALEKNTEKEEVFFCNKCQISVEPNFQLLEKSALLKAICSKCNSYIKFAKKSSKNLKKAKKI